MERCAHPGTMTQDMRQAWAMAVKKPALDGLQQEYEKVQGKLDNLR